MKRLLYYVQGPDGLEHLAKTVEVSKVSEVTADRRGEIVRLLVRGESVQEARVPTRVPLTLYRVPANDKLATPVAHPVKESQP